MEDYERSQIEALLDRDPELRDLWKEHLELEARIEKIESVPHPSPSEELKRKQLQKHLDAVDKAIASIRDAHAALLDTDC